MKCCKENPRAVIRQSVTIQQPPEAVVDAGGHVDQSNETWTTYLNAKAQIDSKTGREFFRGVQVQGDVTHVLSMGFSNAAESINNEMRVKINRNNKILNIVSVRTDYSKPRRVVLQCKEVA